jgi:hypothetical protein
MTVTVWMFHPVQSNGDAHFVIEVAFSLQCIPLVFFFILKLFRIPLFK